MRMRISDKELLCTSDSWIMCISDSSAENEGLPACWSSSPELRSTTLLAESSFLLDPAALAARGFYGERDGRTAMQNDRPILQTCS